MAEQKYQCAPGRLLQNLEQRVGALALEIIDYVDDGDAPAALACGRAEKGNSAPHILDTDCGEELARFFVDHALKYQEIVLRLRGDAPRHRMFGIDGERSRRLHLGALRIGMSEHESRQPVGKRRLADAGRAPDQPGM